MVSVFSKNAIMAGSVDYFCLACETQLRGDEDALHHIAKPIHKKNLDGTSFLDKYKEDRVRKVKKGYYCECCNLFMRTAAKVGPHVAETRHQENKTNRPLRREGNGVIAFDSVFISENAWHGIIDDTCAVCDAEFDNAQIHKTDTWHALNLVLIDIEVSANNNMYRKVDESTFQCLTCNLVCALNTMATHFEDEEHKKLYQQCCEAAKTKLNGKQDSPKIAKEDKERKSSEKETEKPVKEEKANKSEAEQKPAENGHTKTVKARKSLEKEMPNDKSKQSPENQTPNEIPKKAETEPPKEDASKKSETEKKVKIKGAKDALGKSEEEICKGLGAVNYITRDVCGKQWCILCDWAMDDNAVEAHVRSRHHQTILKMHKERQEENQVDPKTNCEDPNENKSRISDAAAEFQKNDIKLDLINGSAYCRKCSKSIDFDFDLIKNHIDEHKKPKEVKTEKAKEMKPFPSGCELNSSTNLFTTPVHKNDTKSKDKERESRASSVSSTRDEAEVEAYAKQNNLTYSKDNNNAFCRLCVMKVPASLKNMKEHINGISHKNKVAKKTVKPTVKMPRTTPCRVFVDSIVTIENIFSKDIVINERFVVNILSFLMITKNGGKLRCQACEVNLGFSEIDSHKNTPTHERVMSEAPVALADDLEFIREIRPNLFHCGYCNQLEATWATMVIHLKSTSHREAKTRASWQLVEYLPMIQQHKAQRERRDFDLFMRMIMGQMFPNY